MVGKEFRHDASVVERFAEAVAGVAARKYIEQASIYEPARIVAGPSRNGVELKFLDLSSLSASGTFKDWAACVTTAYSLQRGIQRFVTQSSGSTANALALYSASAGIELIALYPRASRHKINPDIASLVGVTLVEVDHPEPQLKIWVDEIAKKHNVPWLPDLELQRQGNKLRAYFLNAWMEETNDSCDWHAQALSSAFGPIGTYTGFNEIAHREELHGGIPRFLGVQQESVHPFATFITGALPAPSDCPVIEPTLFRTEPTPKLLEEVQAICEATHGTVSVVNNETVAERMTEINDIFSMCQLEPVTVDGGTSGERLLELAGPICLAGVLDRIDTGLIRRGESVLVVLTGGFCPRSAALYEPDLQIERDEGIDDLLALLDEAGAWE